MIDCLVIKRCAVSQLMAAGNKIIELHYRQLYWQQPTTIPYND